MNAAAAIAAIMLVPFAAAALALANTGLVRSRNAAHTMLASLAVMAVAAVVFFACGFAWQGLAGRPAHVVHLAGKACDWMADEPLFFRGLEFDGSPAPLAAWLGMVAAAVAALIPLGAGAERWRLGPACVSAALLAGCTYPVFAHWTWGGGWLAQSGFVDAGGAASIHAAGGLTALAVAYLLGPRRAKYSLDGMPAALPGHNALLPLLACALALPGWWGLNGAGAMLFGAAPPARLPLIALNTTLSASGALLAAAGLTRLRFGRPDASLCANGWMGGLVAGSAGCALVPPAGALLIGLTAGVLVVYSVEWIDIRLGVDDPAGAISVHGAGGIWGVLAAGIFSGRMAVQLAGISTLLGFVLPVAFALNWLLDRVYPQRAAADGETRGLDLDELGAGAYPEFLTHGEEFLQR